jgi:hypothetical protein
MRPSRRCLAICHLKEPVARCVFVGGTAGRQPGMSADDWDIGALKREWAAARVVAALVIFLVLVFGTMGIMGWWQGQRPEATAVAPSAPGSAEARREEGIAICSAALVAVQNLGLVPQFATLDGGDTQPTGVRGRYVCAAKTDAAKYAVTFDLTCTNLGAANCIAPFSIIQDGNTVIYKRS